MGYKEFHHPRQEVNRVARMETKMMRKMLAVKRLIRNRWPSFKIWFKILRLQLLDSRLDRILRSFQASSDTSSKIIQLSLMWELFNFIDHQAFQSETWASSSFDVRWYWRRSRRSTRSTKTRPACDQTHSSWERSYRESNFYRKKLTFSADVSWIW